jgi:hypothetical protein
VAAVAVQGKMAHLALVELAQAAKATTAVWAGVTLQVVTLRTRAVVVVVFLRWGQMQLTQAVATEAQQFQTQFQEQVLRDAAAAVVANEIPALLVLVVAAGLETVD